MTNRQQQQGVALVITLILLSVITFTAITFLIVSRREKGAVATSTDQRIAELAADAGSERAQAEILATILATTNQFNYGLKVSTNYINPLGFDPDPPNNEALDNVNYDYTITDNVLTDADRERNIANLFYNPRPPVYVFPGPGQTGPPDFRFYLDLNQSGRFDTNGWVPVIDEVGDYVFNDEGLVVSNFMVGDPEWIGVLERPSEPHGPDNRFVARYATLVVPSGRTLDMNQVHNQANLEPFPNVGYRRNMGAGTWELNLAAFLVDLNTNLWTAPDDAFGPNPYVYDPLGMVPTVAGNAFEDAWRLTSYRYDPDFQYATTPWQGLRSVEAALGGVAAAPFEADLIDAFGSGPNFLTGLWPPRPDNDVGRTDIDGWPGDEAPQNYFSLDDLFDETKVGATFPAKLTLQTIPPGPATNSTYNRYTYYRLLSQMGTDGGPEPSDKINLNYDNQTRYRNGIQDPDGVASVTNFVAWDPKAFFIEAADNLLREYHGDHFVRTFGADYVRDNNLALNVPIVTNGLFAYTPSIQRVLQLAANMYDATTNSANGGRIDFPTVFRPLVGRPPNVPPGIYIVDWEVVEPGNTDWRRRPLDIFDRDDLRQLRRGVANENLYNVPWIIGAKKGLPNFNELAIDNIFEVTRKLQFQKPSVTARPNRTNQMYLISVNSAVGVEAWNSYRTAFPGTVDVYATNELDVVVTVTNSPKSQRSSVAYRATFGRGVGVPNWVPTGSGATPNRQSFLAPIATNFTVFTNAIVRGDNGQLETVITPAFQGSLANEFPVPQMTLAYTNRLQLAIIERASGRLLDYVHLRAGDQTNLTALIADPARERGYDGMFVTNRLGGNEFDVTAPPLGVVYQIEASQGTYGTPGNIWRDYGFGQAAGETARKEIDKFTSFMLNRRSAYPPYGYSSNLVMQAPFSPSKRIHQQLSWQANDPLVHYTDRDLSRLSIGPGLQSIRPPTREVATLENIGRLNDRYQPWGGNPDSSADSGRTGDRNYDLRFKDPLVRRSDDWQFPTNKFPNVGWLGRVHRGTPWQTVYLKAPDLDTRNRREVRDWIEWTGNEHRRDWQLTAPQEDRRLFDLFTATLSDTATRGQLSVNQDGLAAWSAVLSGVIVLSNTTPDDVIQDNPFYVLTNVPVVIPPAGVQGMNSPLGRIVAGINADRNSRENGGAFRHAGDLLQVEELTTESPFLNRSEIQQRRGITDAMYERIPQQIMGLVRGGEQPRFVVYSFGQSLKPAERSLVTSGDLFGLCTNYQVTAEAATRTVLRVDGAPNNPRVTVESFNLLPPD